MAGMSELERMLRAEQITFQSLRFVAAIGGARGRDRMAIEDELTKRGAIVLDVRHPTALVSSSAVLGSACQLLMGTIVGPVARLGRSVIMNTGSQLDHDCVVGDGVHLGPGAVVAGEVTVGDRTFIGAGAVILPRVTIGCDVVVGAGAVVTVNIADGLVVSGVPAKKVSHVVE